MPAPTVSARSAGGESVARACIVVVAVLSLLLYLVYNMLTSIGGQLEPIPPTSLASITSMVMLVFAWATLVLASLYSRV